MTCALYALQPKADALVSSQITLSLLVALGSLQLLERFLLLLIISFANNSSKRSLHSRPLLSPSFVFLRLSSHLEIHIVQYGTYKYQPHACMQLDSDKRNPYEAFGETLFSGLSPGPRILDIAFQVNKRPAFYC